MIKKIVTTIWTGFLYTVSYPLMVAFTLLMWYSKYVDGVEPKVGSMLFKRKTINGQMFFKQRGLKNIFKPWEPVPKGNPLDDLSINSFYPHIVTFKARP